MPAAPSGRPCLSRSLYPKLFCLTVLCGQVTSRLVAQGWSSGQEARRLRQIPSKYAAETPHAPWGKEVTSVGAELYAQPVASVLAPTAPSVVGSEKTTLATWAASALTTLPPAVGLAPTSLPTFAPPPTQPWVAEPVAEVPALPPSASPTPKVFFLFMVYSKISNEKVWERFFLDAVRGSDYHALVHCKFESGCKGSIQAPHIFEMIPTVATTYCFDLVTAMNTLLLEALARGGAGHPNDKFVFISDSTLPVKPFATIKQRLLVDSALTSDFCVFPRNEWAEVQDPSAQHLGAKRIHAAVKHHQWIILSRAHALQSVGGRLTNLDLMTKFHMNNGGLNQGCLDEFWYFATLFGTLNLTASPASFPLKAYNGGPLTSMNYQVQGQCSTFVHWSPRAEGTANNLTQLAQLMKADPGTDINHSDETKPASIGRLSKASLESMRDSWFLFARKVEDTASFSGCDSLPEAFDALVFTSPPRALMSIAQPWLGQGAWLDNRNAPVSITSSEGSLRLLGSAGDLDAKGSYCDKRIDVTFTNTYKASATLSPDAQQLLWSNGVAWHRVPGSV